MAEKTKLTFDDVVGLLTILDGWLQDLNKGDDEYAQRPQTIGVRLRSVCDAKRTLNRTQKQRRLNGNLG